jgi:hypothetical protein
MKPTKRQYALYSYIDSHSLSLSVSSNKRSRHRVLFVDALVDDREVADDTGRFTPAPAEPREPGPAVVPEGDPAVYPTQLINSIT